MPSFVNYYEWKKYTITLDDNGQPIAYAVEVNARGKGPAQRRLWYKASGKPIPKRLLDVMNVAGTDDTIAYVMGWVKE